MYCIFAKKNFIKTRLFQWYNRYDEYRKGYTIYKVEDSLKW